MRGKFRQTIICDVWNKVFIYFIFLFFCEFSFYFSLFYSVLIWIAQSSEKCIHLYCILLLNALIREYIIIWWKIQFLFMTQKERRKLGKMEIFLHSDDAFIFKWIFLFSICCDIQNELKRIFISLCRSE
jgi:hypothetical protein